MGGRIIQPGKLWELARARLLRETLRNGATPSLVSAEISAPPASDSEAPGWNESDREALTRVCEMLEGRQ